MGELCNCLAGAPSLPNTVKYVLYIDFTAPLSFLEIGGAE